MKQTTLYILAGIGGLFLMFMLIGAVSAAFESEPEPKQSATYQDKGWNNIRTNFMDGCTNQEDVTWEYCNCTFKNIKDTYSKEEFVEIAVNEEYGKIGKQSGMCYDKL